MYKFLFLMSHHGSNYRYFSKNLSSHPEIDLMTSDESFIYDSYESIKYLQEQPHKCCHAAGIYMDEILFNYKFQRKALLPNCFFIFYLGEPRTSLQNLVDQMGDVNVAIRHYLFRLQGMYEYIVRTKGLIVTWEDWRLKDVQERLILKDGFEGETSFHRFDVDYSIAKKAEKIYESFWLKVEAFHKA